VHVHYVNKFFIHLIG